MNLSAGECRVKTAYGVDRERLTAADDVLQVGRWLSGGSPRTPTTLCGGNEPGGAVKAWDDCVNVRRGEESHFGV